MIYVIKEKDTKCPNDKHKEFHKWLDEYMGCFFQDYTDISNVEK